MHTRQPPSPAVDPKNDTVRRTSSTRITVKSLPVFSLIDALEHQEVGMRLGGDALRHRMVVRDRERRRRLHVRCRRIGMREHEPRHPVGQRRLADAGRAADQPGMRHASRAIGVEHRLLGLGVTDERAGLARMWKLVLVVARGGRRHDATPSSATGAVAGSSRLLTTFQIWSATSGRVPLASISTQRFGSIRASMRKASRSLS